MGYAISAARWLLRISPPEPSGFFVTLEGLVSPDTGIPGYWYPRILKSMSTEVSVALYPYLSPALLAISPLYAPESGFFSFAYFHAPPVLST